MKSLLRPVRRLYKYTIHRISPSIFRRVAMGGAALVVVFLVAYSALFAAPTGFPEHTLIRIDRGETLDEITTKLENQSVVRSAFWLKNTIRLMGGGRAVHAGDYYFDSPHNLLRVAYALRTGDHGLEPAVVTIREGDTIFDIAHRLGHAFESFNAEAFIAEASEFEGYLFPDTYHFSPNASHDDVIEQMHANFNKKISPLLSDIREFGRPLKDVIIMASLLEKEARTQVSKQMIAGILWKRIEIDMPLQVDAVFPYIIGKNTFELTLADLQYESPYNTYRYRGLPPGAIANPGLDSIKAAITPQESNYLFYLSDHGGGMHYSETFEEHKQKKQRYLN